MNPAFNVVKYAVIEIGACQIIVHGDPWSRGWIATAPGSGGWDRNQRAAIARCLFHWSERAGIQNGLRSAMPAHQCVPTYWERDDGIIGDEALLYVRNVGGRLQ